MCSAISNITPPFVSQQGSWQTALNKKANESHLVTNREYFYSLLRLISWVVLVHREFMHVGSHWPNA